jgi:hypothetical protein
MLLFIMLPQRIGIGNRRCAGNHVTNSHGDTAIERVETRRNNGADAISSLEFSSTAKQHH